MKRSHVNNSGHGVYIPRYIHPEVHEWAAGEEIVLRTQNGDSLVGLSIEKGKARCSAGWNRIKERDVEIPFLVSNTRKMNSFRRRSAATRTSYY
ncbi:hypothetical protein AgCh_004493 [Apium graveolens]